MDKERIEEIEKELQALQESVVQIREDLKGKREGFRFSDFIQEVMGATLLAFPFAANADIWELSKKISFLHVVLILILITAGLFFAIKYSNLGNFKVQQVAGFLPLRLITILSISLFVSALSLLVLGVYPSIVDNLGWFFKATVLITLFSVMGSFGLDAAK
ncbi:putative integral membrane protein DUF2391 [Thermovibrio guaymasensis]|uniref:Putative integral membrane protein DUF2391 n=1 Tax=Thermovibrio guaymasensis TaxID=240167 RepID=A0A420W7K3_9BACT|nr:DUF2391 family protein [Thermovibrio guaymasensis]RKQ63301.1 putative integral membrane protein DUF2391 [Thermovibrio guaymasensis]